MSAGPYTPSGASVDQWFQQGVKQLSADDQASALALWTALSAAQKTAVVDSGLLPNSFTGQMGTVTLAQIQQAVTQARQPQQQYGSTTPAPAAAAAAAKKKAAAPAPASPAGQQASASQAAGTVSDVLGETTTGTVAPGIKVPSVQPGSTTLAFNEQLSQYLQQQFSAAGSDPTSLGVLAGVDPATLQSQYQSYLTSFQQAQARYQMGRPGAPGATKAQAAALTINQFAQSKATAQVGPYSAILQAISSVYQGQMGVPLPSPLALQIVTALNQMRTGTPGQQDNLQGIMGAAYQYMINQAAAVKNNALADQTGSYASGILTLLPQTILEYSQAPGTGPGTGSFSATAGIVGTYMSTYPSASFAASASQQEIASDWQKAFGYGTSPSAADLAALGPNPTPAAIQNYINQVQMPGMNMTYGQYQTTSSNVSQAWAAAGFGAPTQAQIEWGVGKTTEQIQDFVDNSQSAVPGVTVGRYNDYLNFVNGLDTSGATTHAFSGQVDASLIADLHQQITSQATGTAHPGAMS